MSGFSLFKDLDQARGVLARMTAKATHAIAVLDVPDAPPLFDRGWMLHALAETGASAIQIEDSRLEGDPLAGLAFNVFARI